MLSHAKLHESLTGKLLLSTALVAVTVGYGWWQHNAISTQQAAAIAAMQMPAAPAQAPAQAQTQAMSAAAPQSTASAPGSPGDANAAQSEGAPDSSTAAAPAAPKSTQLAMAAPTATPSTAPPPQNVMLPATPPPAAPPMPLTGMAAIQAFLPTEGISPPLPPVTGTPDAGATPAIPAGGTHLEDGDYTSDKVQFEWGDLRARIVVTGGKITTVQIVSYPDHRSQSLYLIQLADPILTTEVIKSQQSKVNVVSSATNSSIAFQDAIAGAIVKATR